MTKRNDIADALAELPTEKKLLKPQSVRNQSTIGPQRRLRDWSTELTFDTDDIQYTGHSTSRGFHPPMDRLKSTHG
jgi:hypothetical protein